MGTKKSKGGVIPPLPPYGHVCTESSIVPINYFFLSLYRGPLYGLPISVKECFFVKGYDATAGLARYIDSPAEEDGGMVKVSFHFCQNLCFQ